MKRDILQISIVTVLLIILYGCRPYHTPTPATNTASPASIPSLTPISVSSSTPTVTSSATPTSPPPGKTLIVSDTSDSGPDTLRQMLLDAQPGDTITFDPAVFPPAHPETISITSALPDVNQGNLTIDASNAGVILDGGQLPRSEFIPGLNIVSDGNIIRGMQINGFTSAGIVIALHGKNNTIGGDRNTGDAPTGQGNLLFSNNFGLGIWDFASDNTIIGNLIGTDAGGIMDLGNHDTGIWITEGGTNNVLGPDNIIAHNSRFGIIIQDNNSVGNAITRNSIYDNGIAGIRLLHEGNMALPSPLIIDFDLADGIITGTACANCKVEVFSDEDDEGAVYEGQAVAGSNGDFTFYIGAIIAEPHLTFTATDLDGNTSEFSIPTNGNRESLSLQDRNDRRCMYIIPKKYAELPDNRIGDMFSLDRRPSPCTPPAEQTWDFRHVGDLSLKWVRLSLDRLELEQIWNGMGEYSQFEFNTCQDEIISLLAENDITMLYTIVYWDENIHQDRYPDYGNEEEIQSYLDYTRKIVRYFKDRIQYYEILNEACVYVSPHDYVNLADRAVHVIREEYPDARIVVGGSSNLMYSGNRNYLSYVLNSDIMPTVNAIALHPMYGSSPQYNETSAYYYQYPSLIQSIKQTTSDHGFKGEIIAEEMNWRTVFNTNPDEPWTYTKIVAAKYYVRGIVMNLGLNLRTGIGGEAYDKIAPVAHAVQNLGTTMGGAKPASQTMIIQSIATNIVSYGFSLPYGRQLIALWTDGKAVDYDPGKIATLILKGYSGRTVTGIDVLYGFEQSLNTYNQGDDLVIPDLLVKDYPIILRISQKGVP